MYGGYGGDGGYRGYGTLEGPEGPGNRGHGGYRGSGGGGGREQARTLSTGLSHGSLCSSVLNISVECCACPVYPTPHAPQLEKEVPCRWCIRTVVQWSHPNLIRMRWSRSQSGASELSRRLSRRVAHRRAPWRHHAAVARAAAQIALSSHHVGTPTLLSEPIQMLAVQLEHLRTRASSIGRGRMRQTWGSPMRVEPREGRAAHLLGVVLRFLHVVLDEEEPLRETHLTVFVAVEVAEHLPCTNDQANPSACGTASVDDSRHRA